MTNDTGHVGVTNVFHILKVGIKRKIERNIPTVHYPRKGRKGKVNKESTRRLHRHREQRGSFSRHKTEIDYTTRTVGGMNDLTQLTVVGEENKNYKKEEKSLQEKHTQTRIFLKRLSVRLIYAGEALRSFDGFDQFIS